MNRGLFLHSCLIPLGLYSPPLAAKRHTGESRYPENPTGFRVKHGMTAQERRRYPAACGGVVHSPRGKGINRQNVKVAYARDITRENKNLQFRVLDKNFFARCVCALIRGYQHDLLRYCDEEKNKWCGRIEFAVGCDVSVEFKKAVLEIAEEDWMVFKKRDGSGEQPETARQWAEEEQLTSGELRHGYPRWSPDGNEILFFRCSDQTCDCHIYTALLPN